MSPRLSQDSAPCSTPRLPHPVPVPRTRTIHIERLEPRSLLAADLTVASLHVTPGTVLRADGIRVFGSIQNLGDAAFSSSARTVRFFLSTSSTFGQGTDFPIGSLTLGNIAPGQLVSFDRTTSVPSNAPAGSYFVTALADPDNAVAESSETNNTRGTPIATVRISDQLIPVQDQVALDTSFGTNNGKASALLNGTRIVTNATLVDPQGRVLVAGARLAPDNPDIDGTNILLRFLPNGALDTNFGTGGLVTTTSYGSNFGRPLALTSEGQILFLGSQQGTDDQNRTTYRFALTRYTDTGTPDPTFAANGTRTYDVASLISSSNFAQVPFTSPLSAVTGGATGSDLLESGAVPKVGDAYLRRRGDVPIASPKDLANPGPVFSVASAVEVDRQGRIYLGGSVRLDGNDDFAILRLTADGAPDPAFAGTGAAAVDYFVTNSARGSSLSDIGVSLTLTRDGGVVLAGPATDDASGNGGIALLKFTSAGKLDRRFASVGAIFTGPAGPLTTVHDVRTDRAGRIVVAGSLTSGDLDSPNFGGPTYIACYLANGALDRSFGTRGQTLVSVPGYLQNTARAIHFDKKNRILIDSLVAADVSDVFNDRSGLAILRLAPGGKLDRTFGNKGAAVVYAPPVNPPAQARAALAASFSQVSIASSETSPSSSLTASATTDDFSRTGQAIAAFTPSGDILAIASTDNSTSSMVLLTAVIADGANLSATVSAVTGRFLPGQTLTASVRISNSGSLPARGPVLVSVYANSASTTPLATLTKTISLANGLLTTVRLSFLLDFATPPGPLTILAGVVPTSNAIIDVNPADNVGDGKTITIGTQ